MNDYQKRRFAHKIVHNMFNTVTGKRIAIFGFAFKKDTNDTRESPAISVCRDLITEQAKVTVYDPKVPADEIRRDVLGKDLSNPLLSIASNAYEAATGAHALAITTEWDEFRTLDFERIFGLMSKPAFVFDGRNILDLPKLKAIGFRVAGTGK